MIPASTRQQRAALVWIHLAVLLAGATGLFGKLLPVHPSVLTGGRTLIGGLALAVVAAFLRVDLRLRNPRAARCLLLSGVMLAIHWFTFFQAIQVSTVAIGLLAVSTFPLIVTFLEPLFFRETLHRREIATAVLVTAGLALVTPSFDFGNRLTQGVLWGLLSAFGWACVSLLSRAVARTFPPVTIGFYQQAIAALCTLPFALRWADSLTPRDLWLLLVLGVVFTALLQVLILIGLRHVRAQTAGILFGLEPVYGAFLAWMLLGEMPALRTLVGGVLICGAVVWASFTHTGSGR